MSYSVKKKSQFSRCSWDSLNFFSHDLYSGGGAEASSVEYCSRISIIMCVAYWWGELGYSWRYSYGKSELLELPWSTWLVNAFPLLLERVCSKVPDPSFPVINGGLFRPHNDRGVSTSLRYHKIIQLTLRVHEAAAQWNALCVVLLSLRRLETTALLQGRFPCSAI
jgi:hypothetical protein